MGAGGVAGGSAEERVDAVSLREEIFEEIADLVRDAARRYDGDVQQALRTVAALLDRAAAKRV